MTGETYPSVPGSSDRRSVNLSYDAAGRLSSLNSNPTSYASGAATSGITYAAHGAVASELYGNNLTHTISYNNRLQVSQIKLGPGGSRTPPPAPFHLTYNYGTTDNNGNVQSLNYSDDQFGFSYSQSFTYDSLNRLATATETASGNTSWSQTNTYDRYGNRGIDLGGGNQSLSFNPTNNRITSSGYSYDAAGNLSNDTLHAYTFDAENKIKTVDGITAYVYDGEGQRMRKLVGENTRFIYDLQGKEVAEFSGSSGALQKEYIYGVSGLLATIEPTALNSNGTRYLTADHLGTPRVITDAGTATGYGSVVSRHDYKPFGEELGVGVGGRTTPEGYDNNDGTRQKFTQKERDNETGLDYSVNRYYSPTQGRFTSSDQLFADQHESDPQSWNLYTYVGNNPINYTDPLGLWKKVDCDNGGQCWQAEDGDTWRTFAHATGINHHILEQFFMGQTITSGQVFDVSGAVAWYEKEGFLNDPSLQTPIFIPAGGGLVDVNKARAGIGLLSRLGSAIGRWFGRGAKTAQVVERTIEIVQQEGNLVEMVGKSGQGEIRVLTEMTRQGDTLVLRGLHMEGAGRGSMGVRELFQFARQLGREQGVNKVIIEGAERTTGANPGSIPRTVEIKVN